MFIFKNFKKQNSEQSLNNAVNGTNNHKQNGPNNRLNNHVKPMDQFLQKKFSRGIQYNMKIIIRGDRNVGKTCLFYRLQGDKFHEEYIASEEIKVASIQWNYNATDDIIKVEIWDIVDKGKKRDILTSSAAAAATTTITTSNAHSNQSKDVLKMHNDQNTKNTPSNDESYNAPALDAEFVNVYKGTNGVIFLFDMTKAWTFDYIQREIHQCPLNIPILILANHRDMGHHRVITSDQVHGFIDTILKEDIEKNRKRIGQIRYAECSMRNGFGLRYLYKFFNLPYLHLQRETMIKQLERNRSEIDATCQELDALIDSDEYDYDYFLNMLTNKRRMMADQLSATKNVDQQQIGKIPPRSASMPANMSKMANGISNQNNLIDNNEPVTIIKPMPSIIIGANNPLPPKFQQQFQNKSNKNLSLQNNSVKNIEDFVPDDGEQNMFRKFLDEPNLPQTDLPPVDEENSIEDDDEDTLGNNQLVAKYQEELDPEDMILNQSNNEEKIHTSQVKYDDHEVDDKQNLNLENVEKLSVTTITTSTTNEDDDEKQINAEEDDDHSKEKIPVLNIDEIEALESMYISKHSTNNLSQNESMNEDDNDEHNNLNVSSSSIDHHVKSVKKKSTTNNNTNSTKKKVKKSSKTVNNTNDNLSSNIHKTTISNTNTKKKKTKLKTKNSSSTINNDNEQDLDEQKRLEEFLGASMIDDNDTSRDHNSYQMF